VHLQVETYLYRGRHKVYECTVLKHSTDADQVLLPHPRDALSFEYAADIMVMAIHKTRSVERGFCSGFL
jgi:hypothetical protein